MFAVDALSQAPQFYSFPSSVTADRHTYIDKLYGTINEHADPLGPDAAEAIVEEGRIAFRHNAAVYTEMPGLHLGAAMGAFKISRGALMQLAGRGR